MYNIFDDFLKSGALADVANIFIVDGRHRNLSMWEFWLRTICCTILLFI